MDVRYVGTSPAAIINSVMCYTHADKMRLRAKAKLPTPPSGAPPSATAPRRRSSSTVSTVLRSDLGFDEVRAREALEHLEDRERAQRVLENMRLQCDIMARQGAVQEERVQRRRLESECLEEISRSVMPQLPWVVNHAKVIALDAQQNSGYTFLCEDVEKCFGVLVNAWKEIQLLHLYGDEEPRGRGVVEVCFNVELEETLARWEIEVAEQPPRADGAVEFLADRRRLDSERKSRRDLENVEMWTRERDLDSEETNAWRSLLIQYKNETSAAEGRDVRGRHEPEGRARLEDYEATKWGNLMLRFVCGTLEVVEEANRGAVASDWDGEFTCLCTVFMRRFEVLREERDHIQSVLDVVIRSEAEQRQRFISEERQEMRKVDQVHARDLWLLRQQHAERAYFVDVTVSSTILAMKVMESATWDSEWSWFQKIGFELERNAIAVKEHAERDTLLQDVNYTNTMWTIDTMLSMERFVKRGDLAMEEVAARQDLAHLMVTSAGVALTWEKKRLEMQADERDIRTSLEQFEEATYGNIAHSGRRDHEEVVRLLVTQCEVARKSLIDLEATPRNTILSEWDQLAGAFFPLALNSLEVSGRDAIMKREATSALLLYREAVVVLEQVNRRMDLERLRVEYFGMEFAKLQHVEVWARQDVREAWRDKWELLRVAMDENAANIYLTEEDAATTSEKPPTPTMMQKHEHRKSSPLIFDVRLTMLQHTDPLETPYVEWVTAKEVAMRGSILSLEHVERKRLLRVMETKAKINADQLALEDEEAQKRDAMEFSMRYALRVLVPQKFESVHARTHILQRHEAEVSEVWLRSVMALTEFEARDALRKDFHEFARVAEMRANGRNRSYFSVSELEHREGLLESEECEREVTVMRANVSRTVCRYVVSSSAPCSPHVSPCHVDAARIMQAVWTRHTLRQKRKQRRIQLGMKANL